MDGAVMSRPHPNGVEASLVSHDRTGSAAAGVAARFRHRLRNIYRTGEPLAAAITASRDPAVVGPATVYSHLAMAAGIVVTAVGQELVIAHPLAHTPPGWIVVMLGGPALFLAGRALVVQATPVS
jgi:hypothetical protein